MSSYLLFEMPDEPDCRFIAAWLFRAAQAQRLWMSALDDCEFADHVGLLHADGIPDIGARAMEIFGEVEHQHHVAVVEWDSDDGLLGRELALMERLGFFVYRRGSYWMVLSKTVTSSVVRRAALEVASTTEIEDGLEMICPERLLRTLAKDEAEAVRARLIAQRRFSASREHEANPAATRQ